MSCGRNIPTMMCANMYDHSRYVSVRVHAVAVGLHSCLLRQLCEYRRVYSMLTNEHNTFYGDGEMKEFMFVVKWGSSIFHVVPMRVDSTYYYIIMRLIRSNPDGFSIHMVRTTRTTPIDVTVIYHLSIPYLVGTMCEYVCQNKSAYTNTSNIIVPVCRFRLVVPLAGATTTTSISVHSPSRMYASNALICATMRAYVHV